MCESAETVELLLSLFLFSDLCSDGLFVFISDYLGAEGRIGDSYGIRCIENPNRLGVFGIWDRCVCDGRTDRKCDGILPDAVDIRSISRCLHTAVYGEGIFSWSCTGSVFDDDAGNVLFFSVSIDTDISHGSGGCNEESISTKQRKTILENLFDIWICCKGLLLQCAAQ